MASKAESSVFVQQCWKTMLERPQKMQLNINVGSLETDSGKQRKEAVEVLVVLQEDMQKITYSGLPKSKKETTIEISSISSVLSGKNLPDILPDDQKSRSFSLVVQRETFVFVAPSEAVAKHWILGLQRLVDNQKLWNLGKERGRMWSREVFQKFSSSADHILKSTDVLEKVVNSERVMITEDFYTQKLKEFLKKKKLKYKSGGFFSTREHFEEFYEFTFEREEVVKVFRRTAANGVFVTPSDLSYFLIKEQCEEHVTLEHCEEIIRAFETTKTGREKLEMQVQGFTHFLLSREGELFNKVHDQIYQDMSQPLPHYYIASSHNTYLCGRQLSGESSAKAYTNVIEKGCRCVELDCWDGDDGEPIVYHGHTFTSKVLFKDIVKAIDESAFQTSPYPLIMSLENHCSIEAQKKMAKYLEEILGEKLYKIPVDLNLKSFPSPEFFKYKILVRGKLDIIEEDEEEFGKQETCESTGVEDGAKMKESSNPSIKVTASPGNDVHPTSTANAPSTVIPSPMASPSTRRRRFITSTAKNKVAKELADLINYISNSKFLSYADCAMNGKFYHSSSFAEKVMEDHVQKNTEAFIGYNMRQISRIYPGGLRIDSSNYDPQKPWNVGCQVVALNHQTNDEPMHLYYGKFRQNGRAGYILKPIFLRDPSFKFNPLNARPNKTSKILKLTVLSGQQLPAQVDMWSFTKDEPDPYVHVQVRGVPADDTTITTSVIMDNSFNPIWNERFEIKVLVPELAMVRFSVWDKDIGMDDFIGQATLPFESMQQGYRHVPLMDMENQAILCASIFVHIVLENLI